MVYMGYYNLMVYRETGYRGAVYSLRETVNRGTVYRETGYRGTVYGLQRDCLQRDCYKETGYTGTYTEGRFTERLSTIEQRDGLQRDW